MDLRQDDVSTQGERSTGGVSSGSLEGVPTSNARLTRRAMVEFTAQLAPGLLMKIVTIGPRSCRGARPWRLRELVPVPAKARVDPADRSSATTGKAIALLPAGLYS